MSTVKHLPIPDSEGMYPLPTTADLSAAKHHMVKWDATAVGGAGGVVLNDTQGGPIVGFLNGRVSDFSTTVGSQPGGAVRVNSNRFVLVELAATLGAGAYFMSNNAGEAIAHTTGNHACGFLLEGGDDGDVVRAYYFASHES